MISLDGGRDRKQKRKGDILLFPRSSPGPKAPPKFRLDTARAMTARLR